MRTKDEFQDELKKKLKDSKPWTATPTDYELNKLYALYCILYEEMDGCGRGEIV